MVVNDIYKRIIDVISKIEFAGPAQEASDIMYSVFGYSRECLPFHRDDVADEADVRRVESILTRRISGEPLQYILGEADFRGRKFNVNSSVLIPRHETELIVEEAVKLFSGEKPDILDIGTGSGILAISLSLELNSKITAVDISDAALETARANAQKLGAEVNFIKSNLFEAVEGDFDLIVSNPPYIPTSVIDSLQKEVRLHEPKLALDGGSDGLDLIRIIVSRGRDYLRDGAYILLEIGYDQSEQVMKIMSDCGYEDIRFIKDFSGFNRVVAAKKIA